MAAHADENLCFRQGLARWIMLLQPLACLAVAIALGQQMENLGPHFGYDSFIANVTAGLVFGCSLSTLVFPFTYYGIRKCS
jgi:hypothetical protein